MKTRVYLTQNRHLAGLVFVGACVSSSANKTTIVMPWKGKVGAAVICVAMKTVSLFWCRWWASLTQFCWKKKMEKRGEKENIPRVKALINSLSPREKKRSGFSFRNVSDSVSILLGHQTHIRKLQSQDFWCSGPKNSSNASEMGLKRGTRKSLSVPTAVFSV